ncbi:hypothetical protein [Nannocystis pusilla]|uniref:Uncharacterized protein n=1 Tax=Nannocystis pusilla TaxID=889268 RepID=A0ABS7TS19_9BACT|nr:hypothetical protein [Nannocystis pusilla]MBZ5711018.1 hypothetical protein [Nannocystis pusilla]
MSGSTPTDGSQSGSDSNSDSASSSVPTEGQISATDSATESASSNSATNTIGTGSNSDSTDSNGTVSDSNGTDSNGTDSGGTVSDSNGTDSNGTDSDGTVSDSDTAGLCEPAPGDDDCDACLKANCCDVYIECVQDADCLCLMDCADMGNNALQCSLSCQIALPNLLNTINNVLGECGLLGECGAAVCPVFKLVL